MHCHPWEVVMLRSPDVEFDNGTSFDQKKVGRHSHMPMCSLGLKLCHIYSDLSMSFYFKKIKSQMVLYLSLFLQNERQVNPTAAHSRVVPLLAHTPAEHTWSRAQLDQQGHGWPAVQEHKHRGWSTYVPDLGCFVTQDHCVVLEAFERDGCQQCLTNDVPKKLFQLVLNAYSCWHNLRVLLTECLCPCKIQVLKPSSAMWRYL